MRTSKSIQFVFVVVSGVLLAGVTAQGQTVLFVDDDASTNGDGLSWGTAYKSLQDALAAASGDPTITDVRVAGGVYTPDLDEGGVVTPGDREATFQLQSGLAIQGGYRGLAGGGDPDDRDIEAFVSILSGDLAGNDGPDFANNDENSYHVVTGSGADPTAVLDGFTITAGNANGGYLDANGGGMYNSPGNPTLTNCTFSGNAAASDGGGMYNGSSGGYGSSPAVTDCMFNANSAGTEGGAMYNASASNPTVTNCTFSGNSVTSSWGTGGAMYNNGSSPALTDCTFSGNSAADGGGMFNYPPSGPTLTNCTFSGNLTTAGYGVGGGIASWGYSITLTNCTFRGNAARCGGGMYADVGNVTLTNCTFTGNSASERGGGLFTQRDDSTLTLTNCTFSGNSAGWYGGGLVPHYHSTTTLTNSILWGNSDAGGDADSNGLPDEMDESAQIDGYHPARLTVTYSCIQGCATFCNDPDDHNIGQDPLLVDADGPDEILGTDDDDLHLQLGSPCIDTGDNYAPELPPTDFEGDPRVLDGDGDEEAPGVWATVDMGADEFVLGVFYLDIKPGSCPNPFNRSSHGVLPVALVGTEEFDVMEMDVSSVALSRADGVGGSVAPHEGPPGPHSVFEDVATPFEGEPCDCHDLSGDGVVDLSVKFKTDDVVDALLLDDLPAGALVELVVTGSLLDGTPFEASDCVRLVPPGTAGALLAVESSMPGVWIGVDPLDETLDGGGFTDFERSFPLTTVVTLTAEEWSEGRPLRGWQIGGLLHHMGETTVELTIDQDMTARAVYGPTPSGSPKPPGEMTPDEIAPEPFIEGQSLEAGTIDRR